MTMAHHHAMESINLDRTPAKQEHSNQDRAVENVTECYRSRRSKMFGNVRVQLNPKMLSNVVISTGSEVISSTDPGRCFTKSLEKSATYDLFAALFGLKSEKKAKIISWPFSP